MWAETVTATSAEGGGNQRLDVEGAILRLLYIITCKFYFKAEIVIFN